MITDKIFELPKNFFALKKNLFHLMDFTTMEGKSHIKLLNFKNVIKNLRKLKIVDKVEKKLYEKLLPNFFTWKLIKKKFFFFHSTDFFFSQGKSLS